MTSTPETAARIGSDADGREAPAAAAVEVVPTADELRLALAALDEIAPAGAVGEVLEAARGGAGVIVVRHASALPGYPDWHWTVLLSRDIEGGPTVLEVALLPSQGSLLAPPWVPWADRLADYLAAKEAARAAGEDDDGDELVSDLEVDLDDDDDDDVDDIAPDDDADRDDAWVDADDAESDAEPDDAR